MKIKKITIHNIATIADYTLDFESSLPSGADLVLICGETGTGKTTILDAICLALYGKAPRMEETEMKSRTSDDGEKSLAMNDVRQLMTTGTTESWALLAFTTEDGGTERLYTAGWYCAQGTGRTFDAFIRGRKGNKSANRAYRDAKNFLVCGGAEVDGATMRIDTGAEVVDKGVEKTVRGIVGLDFNQFCRTTMLAQGQFARFYKSSDADKAVILEKILGNNIYSKIGAKIYEKTRDYRTAWERLAEQLGTIEPMTGEERASVASAIAAQTALASAFSGRCMEIGTRMAWLEGDAEIQTAVASATSQKTEAEAAMLAPEYTAAASETALYDDAADIVGAMREVSANEASEARCRASLALLATRLHALGLALQERRSGLAEAAGRLAAEQAGYAEKAPQRQVIGQDAQLVAALNAVISSDNAINKLSGDLARTKDEENRVQDEYNKAQSALEAAQKSDAAAAEALKAGEEELASLSPDDTRTRRTGLENRRGLLRELRTLHSEATAKDKEIAEKESAIAVYDKGIAQSDTDIAALEPQIKTADEVLKLVEKTFSLANIAIDKNLEKVRARLTPGCRCPLCNQEVAHELPQQKELSEEFEALKGEKEKAQKALDNLRDRQNGLKRDKSAAESLKKETQKALEKLRADVRRRRQDIAAKAGGLGLAEGWEGGIDAQIEAVDADILRADAAIEKINEAQARVAQLRKAATEAAAAVSKAREKSEAASTRLASLRASAASLGDTLRSRKAEKAAALAQAGAADPGHVFGDPGDTDPAALLKAYMDERDAIAALKASIDRRSHDIEVGQKELAAVQSVYGRALAALPAEALQAAAASAASGPLCKEAVTVDNANELAGAVSTATAQLAGYAEKKKACEESLQRYLDSRGDVPREALAALAAKSADEIKKLRGIVSRVRDAVSEAAARLAEAVRRRQAHAAAAGHGPLPEIEGADPGAPLPLLAAAQSRYASRRDQANGEAGRLRGRLEDDRRLCREYSTLLGRVAQAKAVYDKWNSLCGILGDATGDRFRQIALGFVLGSLLGNANRYLHKLTPQYDLVGVPGTLNINIRDNGRGGVVRSGNTPSGGETFLVSLALSLALSEISDRLVVDTLFIDEGFGTLSGQPLHSAIELLQSLQRDTCRRVVLISHNAALREMVPVQVRLDKDPYTCTSKVRTVVLS